MVSLKAFVYNKVTDGSDFKFVPVKLPIGTNPELSEYLIADTLTINQENEYTKPFEFIASSANFQLIDLASTSRLLDFNIYNNIDTFLFVSISIDGRGEFTGYMDITSSFQDEATGFYTIDLVDPIKLLYDSWADNKFLRSEDSFVWYGSGLGDPALVCLGTQIAGDQLIKIDNEQIYLGTYLGESKVDVYDPDIIYKTRQVTGHVYGKCTRGYNSTSIPDLGYHVYGNTGYLVSFTYDNTLRGFLSVYNKFGGIEISVADLNQTFNLNDWKRLVGNIKINDLLLEMQKNYNAVVYIKSDLTLVFKSKYNTGNVTIIDDDVFEEDNTKYFQTPALYNAILINAEDVTAGWEGYGFISTEKRTEIIGINEDLENIPKGYNYLDLRTLLPRYNSETNLYEVKYGFDAVLFESKNLTKAVKVYWNLLTLLTPRHCKIFTTNISPMQIVKYKGSNYIIQKAVKHPGEDYSDIELLMIDNIGI